MTGVMTSLRRILMALLIVWLLGQVAGWFMMGRVQSQVATAEQQREAQGRAFEAELRRPPLDSTEVRAERERSLSLRATHSASCQGLEGDRYRGCHQGLDLVRQEQEASGRAWALEHRPTRGYECQGEVWFQLGCREAYEKHLAPGGLVFPNLPLATSSADCEKEMQAYQALDTAYNEATGMPRAGAVHRQHNTRGYQADCQMRRNRELSEAWAAGAASAP